MKSVIGYDLFMTVVDEIKDKIQVLSADQRHEISAFLLKIELEDDPTYWETVRRRVADQNPDNWVKAENL